MGSASFSPLAEQLPERTAPELVYLETKFAALLSYGLTVDILSEILPIGDQLNTRSVRRQLAHSAERMENELGEEQWEFVDGCQRDWNRLPRPDPRLIVGLDGGFVHAKDQPSRSEGWFEVIVGKEHAERRREQMLGLCPNLRPEAEAAFVRITQEPEYADESADHVPDRRRGRNP
jgi:hypothetical protein